MTTPFIAGSDRLVRAIERSTSAGRPSMAAFLTGGFPTPETFGATMIQVALEADVLEVGVPFTDPLADGTTIQDASHTALEAGATLPWILETIEKADITSPVVLMSYLNPLLALGIVPLGTRAGAAGVSGMIIPDLPYEECRSIRSVLDRAGIALIQMVTPVTPAERMRLLCRESRGFVYAVTVTGTTGGCVDGALSADLKAYLDRVRAVSPLPVLAGFGIRTARQVRELGQHADGVIVGSALIECLRAGESPGPFLRQLRAIDGRYG